MNNSFIFRNKYLKVVKLIFTAFVFFGSANSFAQVKVQGTVKDSISNLPNITILLKNRETNKTLDYTITDDKGKYSLQFTGNINELALEFRSLIHSTQTIILANKIIIGNTLKINIKLKQKINELDDVIIKTQKRITLKKDTTIYNVEQFKDGTEKTIEDILKKLPGIKVENNGEIKYKGKSIKKLLLDGDDLFNSDYTIASKNISADIIDKVQGIDNYDENSLKKGLRDSDAVVLNLVLKKGEFDFSGNTDIAYAYRDYYKANFIGLLINKKVKFYNYTSLNNIGHSPKLSTNKTNLNSEKLINEGNFTSILDNSFHNFNNNFTNSTNILFKLFQNSDLRINLIALKDSRNRANFNSLMINDVNQTLITTSEKIKKKPVNLKTEILFKNKEKDSLHWSYLGIYDYRDISTNINSNNNSLFQNSDLQSKRFLLLNKLDLTYRIGRKTALETVLNYSISEAPQKLSLSPTTQFNNGNSFLEFNNQNSRFKKEYALFKSDIIGLDKLNQYKIEAGINIVNNNFKSTLINTNTNQNTESNFKNDTEYKIRSYFLNSSYNFKFKNSNLVLGLKLMHNNLMLIDKFNNDLNENSLLILPVLKFNYKISKIWGFSVNYNFNELLPKEDKLFRNLVQTDYRSFVSNDIALDNLKSHSLNINFKYYDFYNRTSLDFGFQYNHNKNGYFFNNIINEELTITNSFLKNEGLDNYNFSLNTETFVLPLSSTLQLNTNYAIAEDLNTLNESDFRDITINDLQVEFIWRTGFKLPINFENTFIFNNSTFKTTKKNSVSTITNQFKTIFKIRENLDFKALYSYIKPNISNNRDFDFIESELYYSPKKSNFSYSIIAKNLLNERKFEVQNISDFSTSRFSYNLIERYIMLKVGFSF
ncbi:hypothetical protein [uncultured Winogradskyella sp.]|uniref:hypothetical protein n=1 Tax=uncultured Winogradskyella sp. TaxID=395353 RepID=UPI0026245098|nr:hypothetical protein [uncultured Winogradskyella sp.]